MLYFFKTQVEGIPRHDLFEMNRPYVSFTHQAELREVLAVFHDQRGVPGPRLLVALLRDAWIGTESILRLADVKDSDA